MKRLFVITFLLLNSIVNFSQTEFGVASYYGLEFEGRPTASGEIYTQNKLTAAHKTLKLGTVVKVTNAQNNKSVYVKINDRGPFVKGRVIDLSTKAAEMLGYRNKGTTYVKIEIVNPKDIPTDLSIATKNINKEYKKYDSLQSDTVHQSIRTWADIPTVESENNVKPISASTNTTKSKPINIPQPAVEIKESNSYGLRNSSSYYVITNMDKSKLGFYGLQLGVFSDPSVIFPLIVELENLYHENVVIQQVDIDSKIVYKLLVGKFQNRAYADALKLVVSQKYKDAFVVKYE